MVIAYSILYFICWLTYRIVIHSLRSDISNYYLLYRPWFLPKCLICLWYNLGLIEGLIHLFLLKLIL